MESRNNPFENFFNGEKKNEKKNKRLSVKKKTNIKTPRFKNFI